MRRLIEVTSVVGLLGVVLSTPAGADARDIGRDTPPAYDDWATPKIIRVVGAIDLLTVRNAYNSGSERDLTADVGWTPTLHTKIDSAGTADREVARGAGAGRHT